MTLDHSHEVNKDAMALAATVKAPLDSPMKRDAQLLTGGCADRISWVSNEMFSCPSGTLSSDMHGRCTSGCDPDTTFPIYSC